MAEKENDKPMAVQEQPPTDEVEFEADDEEGRFFGGGISNGTAEILDIVEEQNDGDDGVCFEPKRSNSWIMLIYHSQRKLMEHGCGSWH